MTLKYVFEIKRKIKNFYETTFQLSGIKFEYFTKNSVSEYAQGSDKKMRRFGWSY